jgi:hypothetical protein
VKRTTVAAAVIAVACSVVSGCTITIGHPKSSTPKVSKDDLQTVTAVQGENITYKYTPKP